MEELSGGTEASFHLPASTCQAPCDWANLEVETRVLVKHPETEAPGDIWLPLPEAPWVGSRFPTPDKKNKIKRKLAWDNNYSLQF